jgi:isopenicillin-N N-acyltransferase-like protein
VALPHHISRESSPADRGRAFGAAHASAIACTVRTYRRLLDGVDLRAAGAAVAPALAPHHVEELHGIAAGAGQDARELIAVNARTELLAGAECSVAGRLGGPLAQTWDWHPDLAPARVVWTVEGSFTTVTEAGILAKLGINEHGVAVALNLLTSPSDGGLGGTPVHILLRRILERATNAQQALELLTAAGTTASSAVTMATADELFTVELSPDGPTVIRPDADGWLVHTNHFLTRPPGDDEDDSRARHDRLTQLLRAGAPVKEALAHAPICRHDDPSIPWPDRIATLLAIHIDPGARSLEIADGPPCEAPFVSVADARERARPPAPRPRARAG